MRNFFCVVFHVSCCFCVTMRFILFTGRPVQSAAMPVLFLLIGPKIGFSSRRFFVHCLDKREIFLHRERTFGSLPSPCQILRLSGQNCENTAPETVKILNFGNKFAPQGSLVWTIFTNFLGPKRLRSTTASQKWPCHDQVDLRCKAGRWDFLGCASPETGSRRDHGCSSHSAS